jgi:predicted DNA-binding transcriptional regulator YafY
MSVQKKLERLKELDRLIHLKATGRPALLASRFGISQRTLHNDLVDLKEMGCNARFCESRESYVYGKDSPRLKDFFE